MKDLRTKDVPLCLLLGLQIEWLVYNCKRPKDLPNNLTKLRMRLIPIQLSTLLAGIVLHNEWLLGTSLGILSFQGLTDWVDGYIAYHYDYASAEGAQLDPRADKLVVLPNLLIYSTWSMATSEPMISLPLLLMVLMAIWLDVKSDIWYRHNPGGKSNLYGKIKFGVHILVAGIGIAAMIIDPSEATKQAVALGCAFLMLFANVCARISLNLKQRNAPDERIKDHLPSLLEGLAHAHQTSID